MIISGDLKEFNSTLMKIKIQTRSSSRYLRRLPVQSWELATKRKVQSVSKPILVNRGVLKTLRRICRLSKNHWSRQMQSPYFRHKTDKNHWRNVKTRDLKPASQHHCKDKMQGSKSASQHHCKAKTQGSKPASQHACISIPPQRSNTKLKTRV